MTVWLRAAVAGSGSRPRRGERGGRGVVLGLRAVDGGLADVLLLQELAVALQGRSGVREIGGGARDLRLARRDDLGRLALVDPRETWPFVTRSPTSARSSTIRPAICAATVDWRTASTTPSAA